MSSINEAAVFEYLKEQAKQNGLTSLSMRVNCDLVGDYVAAWNETGQCGVSGSIAEAVSRLPDRQQTASGMIRTAEELEAQAKTHREKAAKLLNGGGA